MSFLDRTSKGYALSSDGCWCLPEEEFLDSRIRRGHWERDPDQKHGPVKQWSQEEVDKLNEQ